ncbi:hypothetical protein HDV00_012060 [Rhizophlyctis rosea]|nr:hypothetical protein HDV00_012060 [Rhizophlyctis rosea]
MPSLSFPINIALLGAGIFAKEAHLPVIISNPGVFRLVAVYSKSEASAQNVVSLIPQGHPHPKPQVYHDAAPTNNLDALLVHSEIKAVIVALPILIQPKVITSALAAGKHVLSEKPQAPAVADGLALLQAYEVYQSKGLIWQVAENYRAVGATRHGQRVVKDLIAASGAGSAVRAFDLRTYFYNTAENKYCKTEWRANAQFQGGYILDGGVHFIALLRAVTGLEADKVTAFTRLTEPHLAPVDSVSAAIKMRNGALGTWVCYFCAPQKGAQIELSVTVSAGATGPGGMVTVGLGNDEQGRNGWVVVENYPGREPRMTFHENGGVAEEILGWARDLAGLEHTAALPGITAQSKVVEPFINTPQEALADVALIEAVLTSGQKDGVPVEVARIL